MNSVEKLVLVCIVGLFLGSIGYVFNIMVVYIIGMFINFFCIFRIAFLVFDPDSSLNKEEVKE